MGIGFRFGFGPLRVYIPVVRSGRRRGVPARNSTARTVYAPPPLAVPRATTPATYPDPEWASRVHAVAQHVMAAGGAQINDVHEKFGLRYQYVEAIFHALSRAKIIGGLIDGTDRFRIIVSPAGEKAATDRLLRMLAANELPAPRQS